MLETYRLWSREPIGPGRRASSGPDGEHQAKGQARYARGEPRRDEVAEVEPDDSLWSLTASISG